MIITLDLFLDDFSRWMLLVCFSSTIQSILLGVPKKILSKSECCGVKFYHGRLTLLSLSKKRQKKKNIFSRPNGCRSLVIGLCTVAIYSSILLVTFFGTPCIKVKTLEIFIVESTGAVQPRMSSQGGSRTGRFDKQLKENGKPRQFSS